MTTVEDKLREGSPPTRSDSKPDVAIPWFIWSPANIGLALFLVAECALGAYIDRREPHEVLMWIVVGTVLVVNTIRRSSPAESDTRWWVWLICSLSAIHVLAFESTGDSRIALWILIWLNLLADTSLIALGRSFSLLPARRSIRVGWMYRFVRHPIYSAYMLADAIYVSQLPTVWNGLVLIAGAGLFAWRASLEERLLRNDPVYREYCERTRWRFLPFVY